MLHVRTESATAAACGWAGFSTKQRRASLRIGARLSTGHKTIFAPAGGPIRSLPVLRPCPLPRKLSSIGEPRAHANTRV